FPLTLFAIPDPANETNRFAIEVPYLGSLILTHSLDGAIKGLKEFKPEDRPPGAIPFCAFRIMGGMGFLMLAGVAGGWGVRVCGAGGGGGGVVVALPRWSVRQALVSQALHGHGPTRLRSRPGGMDDDGGRPPALDCLRHAAPRRFDVALARGRRRAGLVAGLHGGLSDHLPVRSPHRGGAGGPGPGGGARAPRAGAGRARGGADRR